jgi:aspartyl-tRNA(Asn)/glutamyl-tRNA(Gln) amidotransferase subunit B
MPIALDKAYIDRVKQTMPALPHELYKKYTDELGLSEYDAGVITADKELAFFFEELIKHTSNHKAAVHLLMGPVKSYLNDHSAHISDINVQPKALAGLIKLVDDGKVNNTVAGHKLFPALIKSPDKTVEQLAGELNLLISNNSNEVDEYINAAIAKFPDKVKEYQKGKKGVVGLFMGEIMKLSKGKIDPQKTNQLLIKELESR